jgi:hypothetical protein
MPKLEPQTRFLLRGSVLLIGLLTLWWFALLDPMLSVLKTAAGGFLHIEENPSGDWSLRVALEKTLPATDLQPRARQIHSIDFDMPRSDLITFTFSLPVYWAIILATPGVRRNLRPLLLGTALMSAVELLLLLAFASIMAGAAASQLAGSHEAAGKWIRMFGVYLVVNVLPYAAPFAVALSLHRELRAEVFAIGQTSSNSALASRRRSR